VIRWNNHGSKFEPYPINVGSDECNVYDGEAGEGARLDLTDVTIKHRDRECRRENLSRKLRNRSDPVKLKKSKIHLILISNIIIRRVTTLANQLQDLARSIIFNIACYFILLRYVHFLIFFCRQGLSIK